MNGRKYSLWICYVIIFLFILGSVTPVAAGTRESPCNWAAGPVEIDGKLEEWKNMPTTFFEDERLILGISNDSTHLYLFLRTDDPNLIRTIRMSGIKLWLDPKGKKKKDLSFHYRGGPSPKELEEAGLITNPEIQPSDHERMPQMTNRFGEMSEKITVIDMDLDFQEVIPSDGTYGPSIRHAIDKGFCVYEISIPLQEHNIDYYGFNAEPVQRIGIGIKWGGRPERDSKMVPPDGGIGGMPGGRGGMGEGRGGRRGGMDRRMQPPQEKEIWVKSRLASPGKTKE